MKKNKVTMASDHAGFELKESIKKHLIEKGIEVNDLGTNSKEAVSYVDYGSKVGEYISDNPEEFGVIVCGTGIGISIAANKHKNVRAAIARDEEYARLSREHNNANVISLGGRFVADYHANNIVDTFLSTEFAGDRHAKRVEELDALCSVENCKSKNC